MRNLAPGYRMSSFWDSIAPWAGGRIDSQWQYNNTTSWFVPDKMGDHDFKFGGTFHRSFIDDFRENFLGGAFHFNTDLPFDIDDYSTYPERLQIRVGAPSGNHFAYPINTWETFFQDKWTLNERWTLGLGVRWDAEMLSAARTDNPLMVPGTDPRDWNNISPRLSVAYDVTGDGRSVLRAGYGYFYDRTLFSGLDNVLQDPVINNSFVASFPRGGGEQGGQADPGPESNMPIQDPELQQALRIGSAAAGECGPATIRDGATHCPLVNHAFVDSVYPPGTTDRFNESNVYIDNYRRQQPLFKQLTLGFERELMPTLSIGVDYVNIRGSGLLNRINYVAPLRSGTASTDPRTWYDAWYGTDRGGVYDRPENGSPGIGGLNFFPSCASGAATAGLYSNPAKLAEECAKVDPADGPRACGPADRRLAGAAAVDRERRAVGLRRPERLGGEALLGPLGHAVVVRGRLLARRHVRAVRHQRHQPQRRPDPGSRQSAHGPELAAGGAGPPAHPDAERAHRAAGRDHPEPHLPLHEQEPVHRLRRPGRPGQERHPMGPASRRVLQSRVHFPRSHAPEPDHGGSRRPPGRRARGGLHQPGPAVRVAGPPGGGGHARHLLRHHQPLQPPQLQQPDGELRQRQLPELHVAAFGRHPAAGELRRAVRFLDGASRD